MTFNRIHPQHTTSPDHDDDEEDQRIRVGRTFMRSSTVITIVVVLFWLLLLLLAVQRCYIAPCLPIGCTNTHTYSGTTPT